MIEELTLCQGCESKGTRPHTIDCLFQHFLSYTAYGNLPDDEIFRLKQAYAAGCVPDTTITREQAVELVAMARLNAAEKHGIGYAENNGDEIAVEALAPFLWPAGGVDE